MEPVEPSMEIRFICLRVIFYRGSAWNANFGFGVCVVAEVKRFNRECTEENRRTQRKTIHRRDAEGAEKAGRDPSLGSLREITQGEQDDDARRVTL